MAMENDKIKDLFSSKFKDFEMEVPASVWGGLDQLLSQQPMPTADPSSSASASTSTTTTVAKASVLKTVLITVGVAVAVVTGVILIPERKEPVVSPEKKEIIKEETDSVIIEEPVLDSVLQPLPVNKKTFEKEVPAPVVKEKEEEPIKTQDIVRQKEPEKEIEEEEEVVSEDKEPVVEETKKEDKSKGFSIAVFANTGLLSENIKENGGGFLFSRNDRGAVFNEALAKENSEFRMKHNLPISFGVKVAKGLTPNLSLETGLVYTYLTSKITSESIFDLNETQTFHYLGIPISLNYTFYKLKKANFYLSVGGMIQKDIYGNYESSMGFSKMSLEDQKLAHQLYYGEPYLIRKNIEQSNLQFSTHLKLGIAYPLYKKLYLYGTVGGAYYFDAHNKYPTIFSDKNTQLDFDLGIKFGF